MTSLLILTVGTGTAGRHSDISQGLVAAIRLAAPRLFWLVPSASTLSIPVADLVRENPEATGTFRPWSREKLYHTISDPDDLHDCRQVVREVIGEARRHLREGERLVVNPTSGTKQMSAGATLAALDAEVGEISFIGGQRADGVVKTGTEKILSLSTETFFCERDLRIARELFEHGSYNAAARVLSGYNNPEAQRAAATALCRHEWQRMNYVKAASHAAEFSVELAEHLLRLSKAGALSPGVLGDLLAGADELLKWGDCEEALARFYRGAELAAKIRLAEAHNLSPPYYPDALARIFPPGAASSNQYRPGPRGGEILLPGQRAWELLLDLGDDMARDYWEDKPLQDGLRQRHETMYGHGGRHVDPSVPRIVATGLRRLLKTHMPAAASCWTSIRRPAFCPNEKKCLIAP